MVYKKGECMTGMDSDRSVCIETRDMLIEVHTDVKYIREELERTREKVDKLDERIRKVELVLLPAVFVLSVASSSVLKLLKP